MTDFLIPAKDERKVGKLRIKLDDAYKKSIEVGIKDFKKGDTEKEVRSHIEKALFIYREKLMDIMRFQMEENEVKRGEKNEL